MTHDNDMNNNDTNRPAEFDGPPHDALDTLLKRWHRANASQANAMRSSLLSSIERQAAHAVMTNGAASARDVHSHDDRAAMRHHESLRPNAGPGPISAVARIGRTVCNRYVPAAASLVLLVTIATLLIPGAARRAAAQQQEIMVPDGGRLDALDELGQVIGPCPLEHTDVQADISGRFTRVTLTQRYHNPYDRKIEAVYTFPLSHRAAVDRMTMTVGERVIIGEIKQRAEARQIYESARAQGYVASLLEQERPNIFTQSVANIEPGAEVSIELSYVETLESIDGAFSFDFPMVVGPRYIPGSSTSSPAMVPDGLLDRFGLILRGPAQISIVENNDALDAATGHGQMQPGRVHTLLNSAVPIMSPVSPDSTWWGDVPQQRVIPQRWCVFVATYGDGSKETGELFVDGTGHINNRWFFADVNAINDVGTGFSPNTDQVPDASRITPMPTRPPTRAGHDLSLTVSIDTGGPGLIAVDAPLHEIIYEPVALRDDGAANKAVIALGSGKTIPNRDFVLTWRQTDAVIEEAHFAHTGAYGKHSGGFFTLMLNPPARVAPEQIVPRELIFVLDTSGSMSGDPIEKSKAVVQRAVSSMRPGDTFNVITFAGHTSVLWDEPRPATEENIAIARRLIDQQQGGGGTEIMNAIHAALAPSGEDAQPGFMSPRDLVELPADGRDVTVRMRSRDVAEVLLQNGAAPGLFTVRAGDVVFRASVRKWTLNGGAFDPADDRVWTMRGTWDTQDGRRVFDVASAEDVIRPDGAGDDAVEPMRIVMFLTDGFVGNEEQIIDAVRQFRRTTRVFSFGIGNSINRFLLDSMAQAGRGEVEYVLLETEPDQAVDRFVKRIETPVLTDIGLAFSDGLEVLETIPPLDAVPDLFDARPLIIHGRYTKPGAGELTITGRTGGGAYQRTVAVELPETAAEHDVIATLWARAQVDELSKTDEVAGITQLGLEFQMLTAHTSFVAVEKARITLGGEPMLVAVPVELPEGTNFEGFFCGDAAAPAPPVNWGVDEILLGSLFENAQLGVRAERLGREAISATDADDAVAVETSEAQNVLSKDHENRVENARHRFGDEWEETLTRLKHGDFARARQEVLTERIQLSRQRAQGGAANFERRDSEIDDLLDLISNLEAEQRLMDVADVEARSAQKSDKVADNAERQKLIEVNLKRVRQAQMNMNYGEAMEVIDEILFLDEKNPNALAIQQTITQNEQYLSYLQRQQSRDFGLANLSQELQNSMVPPASNIDGPGVRSVEGLVQYPEDWSRLSLVRTDGFGRRRGQTVGGAAGEFSGSIQLPVNGEFEATESYGGATPVESYSYSGFTAGVPLYITQGKQPTNATDYYRFGFVGNTNTLQTGGGAMVGFEGITQFGVTPVDAVTNMSTVMYAQTQQLNQQIQMHLGEQLNFALNPTKASQTGGGAIFDMGDLARADSVGNQLFFVTDTQDKDSQSNQIEDQATHDAVDAPPSELADTQDVRVLREPRQSISGAGGGRGGGGGSGGGMFSLDEQSDGDPTFVESPLTDIGSVVLRLMQEDAVFADDAARLSYDEDNGTFRIERLTEDEESIRAEQLAQSVLDVFRPVFASHVRQAAIDGQAFAQLIGWREDPAALRLIDALNTREVAANYQSTPLRDVIRDIGEQAELKITIDADGLALDDISLDVPVTLKIAGTVRTVLESLFYEIENHVGALGIRVDPDTITITATDLVHERAELAVHDIYDLLTALGYEPTKQADPDAMSMEEAAQRVVDILIEMVEPEGWRSLGGEWGRMLTLGRYLFVQASAPLQRRVQSLLDGLRKVLVHSTKDAGDRQSFVVVDGDPFQQDDLTTWLELDTEYTTVHWEQTPLRSAMEQLSNRIGQPIREVAAPREDQPLNLDVPLTLRSIPVSYRSLLEHLLLTAWDGIAPEPGSMQVCDGVISLTTDALKQHTVVYDVWDILANGNPDAEQWGVDFSSQQRLVDIIWEHVDPTCWMVMGGDLATLRIVNSALILRAPAEHHRAVAKFLDRMRIAAGLRQQHPELALLNLPLIDSDYGGSVCYDVGDIIDAARASWEQVPKPVASDNERAENEDIFATDVQLNPAGFNEFVTGEIAESMMSVIDPDNWVYVGAEHGLANAVGRLLIVQHSFSHHFAIEAWLNELRRTYNLPAKQTPQLAALRARFDPDSDAPMSARERNVRLASVIDDDLWPVVFSGIDGAEASSDDDDQDRTTTSIAVSVLVAAADRSTIDAVTAGGLDVRGWSNLMNVVAGEIDPAALQALALVDQVRRIEPLAARPWKSRN